MSDLAIGDSVSFMWGGIPRTGKVIGSCPKKVFIEFNYKPRQVKKKWIGRAVVRKTIPTRAADFCEKSEVET